VIQLLDSLHPRHGAPVAAAVALGIALVARWLGRPLLAGAAAGIGTLAGWWMVLGLLTASPRQLPERLPLLMLALVLAAPASAAIARRAAWVAPVLLALGALATGWWMAGAPLVVPDAGRAAPLLAGVSAATLLLALRSGPRWAAPVAAGALLAGLAAAGLRGPGPALGAAILAAVIAAALVPSGRGGAAHPALSALPVAGALAALAAIPIVARGAPADWAAGAAPLVALLAGAPAGARLHARFGAPAGAVLGGAVAAATAFLLR